MAGLEELSLLKNALVPLLAVALLGSLQMDHLFNNIFPPWVTKNRVTLSSVQALETVCLTGPL